MSRGVSAAPPPPGARAALAPASNQPDQFGAGLPAGTGIGLLRWRVGETSGASRVFVFQWGLNPLWGSGGCWGGGSPPREIGERGGKEGLGWARVMDPGIGISWDAALWEPGESQGPGMVPKTWEPRVVLGHLWWSPRARGVPRMVGRQGSTWDGPKVPLDSSQHSRRVPRGKDRPQEGPGDLRTLLEPPR